MPPFFRRAPHTLPLALCAALLTSAIARAEPTWQTFVAPDAQVVPRVGGALVPLPDGSTLLIGGLTRVTTPKLQDVPTPSVVLFSPTAAPQNQLRALSPLIHEREGHTATLLPDGRVLVVGGRDALGNALASVEIGTPSGNDFTWEDTTPLGGARYFHTTTVLTNGRVLVVGGRTGKDSDLGSAESFDPFAKNNQGKWNGVASLPAGQERSFHTATLLPDGRVLVAGGVKGEGSQNATWLLDPKAPTGNPWKPDTTQPNSLTLASGRAGHQAVLMPSGQVLLVGGCKQAPIDATVCERPARDEFFTAGTTDSWALLDVPPPTYNGTLIFGQSIVGLRSGWVLGAFGRIMKGSDPLDLKDVFTLRPTSASPLLDPIGPIAQPLPGSWHWDPSTQAPQLPTPAASPFHSHATAVVDDRGSVVLAGGRQQTSLVDSVDYFRFGADGSVCTHDDGGLECAGGVCLCATANCTTGTCETPLANGSLCVQADDCTSRACEPTTDQKAQVCCAFACKDTCSSDLAGLQVGTCGATACDARYRSCDGFRCQDDACLTTCTTNDQCAIDYYCKNPGPGGQCAHVQDKGEPCSGPSQCDSGFCVDGVCCESNCAGSCESCDLAHTGKPSGLCTGRSPDKGPREPGQCDNIDGNICGNTGLCDGAGKCAKASAGTFCDPGEPADRNGYECDSDRRRSFHMLCNGNGICQSDPLNCQNFACDPDTSQCASTCDPADTQPDGSNILCATGLLCGTATGICGEGSICVSSTRYVQIVGGKTNTKDCLFNRPCLANDPTACEKPCSSSRDCAPGAVCRQSGECTPPVQASGDDPDCFCAQPGPARPSTPGLLVTLLAVGTLGARRRLSRRAARASR